MASPQTSEMPIVAHGYSAEEVEYDNTGIKRPEARGFLYVKGTGSALSKFKDMYVVIKNNVISVYKDEASSASPGSSLLSFMLIEATIAKEILDKKETFKHAEFGFLIEAPASAAVGKTFGSAKKLELACCFPTLGIYNEWIRQLKYAITIASPVIFGVPVRIAVLKNRGKAPYPIIRLTKFLQDVNKILQLHYYYFLYK